MARIRGDNASNEIHGTRLADYILITLGTSERTAEPIAIRFQDVRFEAVDENLMLRQLPGVFCAGEMLDWEAPTGGYLLTGCFASGRAAGLGVLSWLKAKR